MLNLKTMFGATAEFTSRVTIIKMGYNTRIFAPSCALQLFEIVLI